MGLLQRLFKPSMQHHPTQLSLSRLPYHGPNKKYKIIQHNLVLSNLPAPLHYLNFSTLFGKSNCDVWQIPRISTVPYKHAAAVMCSTSPHMVGQLNHYAFYDNAIDFCFNNKEQLFGTIPEFKINRQDTELSIDLKIQLLPVASQISMIRFGLAEHWAAMCHCEGIIQYQNQQFDIQQLGQFSFFRSRILPYSPIVFYTYQVICLQQDRQITLLQTRDRWNQVILSKIFIHDLKNQSSVCFQNSVFFKVHRVYPAIQTANSQTMYLPREFEWCYADENGTRIWLQAQSRGDYKFGRGAGFAGSFSYQIKMNDELEEGEGGYIEYIDCRPLKFQEQDKTQKFLEDFANPVPFFAKK